MLEDSSESTSENSTAAKSEESSEVSLSIGKKPELRKKIEISEEGGSSSDDEDDSDDDDDEPSPPSDKKKVTSRTKPAPKKATQPKSPATKKTPTKQDPGAKLDDDGNPRAEFVIISAVNNSSAKVTEDELKAFAADPITRPFFVTALQAKHAIAKEKARAALLRDYNSLHSTITFGDDLDGTVGDMSNAKERTDAFASHKEAAELKHPLTEKGPAKRAEHDFLVARAVRESFLAPLRLKFILPSMCHSAANLADDQAVFVIPYNPDPAGTDNDSYVPIPVNKWRPVFPARQLASMVREGMGIPLVDGKPIVCMMALGIFLLEMTTWIDAKARDQLSKALYECSDDAADLFNAVYGTNAESDEFTPVENAHVRAVLDEDAARKEAQAANKRKRESMMKPKGRKDNGSKPAKTKTVTPKKTKAAAKKPAVKTKTASPKAGKRKAAGGKAKKKAAAVEASSSDDDVQILVDTGKGHTSVTRHLPRCLPSYYFTVPNDAEYRYTQAQSAHSKMIEEFERTRRFVTIEDVKNGAVNGTIASGTTSAQKKRVIDENGVEKLVTTPRTALNMQAGRASASKIRDSLTQPETEQTPSESANVLGMPTDFACNPNVRNSKIAAFNRSDVLSCDANCSMTSEELHKFVHDDLMATDKPLRTAAAMRVVVSYSGTPTVIASVFCQANRRGSLFELSATDATLEQLCAQFGSVKGVVEWVGRFLLHCQNLETVMDALTATEHSDELVERLATGLHKIPAIGEDTGNGFDPLRLWPMNK